jgi:hypothetical protein
VGAGRVLVWSGRVALLLGAFLGGEGERGTHPYYFLMVYMAVLPLLSVRKFFIEKQRYVRWAILYIIPLQILRKKIYAKRRGRHYVGIYYTSTLTVQKIFMKVKGMATQGRFGVYILGGFSRLSIYAQWLLNGFQEMAKIRQKSFVKIDNTKVAEILQILL